MVFYTVYRITNLVNGRLYVGCHQTDDLDDGYLGSGKIIRRAVKKYGIDKFSKEVLHIFSNREDMLSKEREIVTQEFCARRDTYNVMPGGHGGFAHMNDGGADHVLRTRRAGLLRKAAIGSDGFVRLQKLANAASKAKGLGIHRPGFHLTNKTNFRNAPNLQKMAIAVANSPEAKAKKKESFARIAHSQGANNSQYGSMWITDGTVSRKIRSDSLSSWIVQGYRPGRTITKRRRGGVITQSVATRLMQV